MYLYNNLKSALAGWHDSPVLYQHGPVSYQPEAPVLKLRSWWREADLVPASLPQTNSLFLRSIVTGTRTPLVGERSGADLALPGGGHQIAFCRHAVKASVWERYRCALKHPGASRKKLSCTVQRIGLSIRARVACHVRQPAAQESNRRLRLKFQIGNLISPSVRRVT